MTESSIVAQGYDAVYEAMARSPTLLCIWKEQAAGEDYPDDFYHISFVTLQELPEIAGALKLTGLPLRGCGLRHGGPALWTARETGAQLRGGEGDFSRVAVTQVAGRVDALETWVEVYFRNC